MRCREVLLLFAAAAALDAGIIRGVVLDQSTGFLLRRAKVRLDYVDTDRVVTLGTVTTSRNGQFLFERLPEGLYLLVITREGYAPHFSGQRRFGAAARPFNVGKETDEFTQIRLQRWGAITGRVLDENDVGIRNVTIAAYPAGQPLRSTATAVSDDRGAFRLFGLAPGSYWIRSQAHRHEDNLQVLPTFTPSALELRGAGSYEARLDTDTPEVDLRPVPGRLFRLRGAVTCSIPSVPPPPPVSIIISSETMRRATLVPCDSQYSFDGLAPGLYEVASAAGDLYSGFFSVGLETDTAMAVEVRESPKLDLGINHRRQGNLKGSLILRRSFPNGDRDTQAIPFDSSEDVRLPVGYWEVHATLPPGHYLESARNHWNTSRRGSRRTAPDPDWFEIFVEPTRGGLETIDLDVSSKGGTITGIVAAADKKPEQGIPVFLWPLRASARRSLNGPRQTLTGTSGSFEFPDLPPGEYRLMASFDFAEPDERAMQAAAQAGIAKQVTIGPAGAGRLELSPYIAP